MLRKGGNCPEIGKFRGKMGNTDFSMTEPFYYGSLLPNVTEFHIRKTFIRPRCLSDISVNGELCVSVISVQTVVQASHSYQSKR